MKNKIKNVKSFIKEIIRNKNKNLSCKKKDDDDSDAFDIEKRLRKPSYITNFSNFSWINQPIYRDNSDFSIK